MPAAVPARILESMAYCRENIPHMNAWIKPDGKKYSDLELRCEIHWLLANEFKRVCVMQHLARKKLDLDSKPEIDDSPGPWIAGRATRNSSIMVNMPPLTHCESANTPGWMIEAFNLDGSQPSLELQHEIEELGIWIFWKILNPELRLLFAEAYGRDSCGLLGIEIIIQESWKVPYQLLNGGRYYLGDISINQKEVTETWTRYEKISE